LYLPLSSQSISHSAAGISSPALPTPWENFLVYMKNHINADTAYAPPPLLLLLLALVQLLGWAESGI
jgi:hypothetical protein